MEYGSKRSLVQEVELMEGKVLVSDVQEDRREIQSAETHHVEDNTEHTSLRKNHHASVVAPGLKSGLSLTEASPPQKLQMDSKNEAVASKTKNGTKGETLSPDDQLVEAPESLLLEQSFSSDKVLVQPKSFVTSREITVGRKVVTQTVSDKMDEMSSQSVSSEQQWTGLFSPITAAPPQKEKPRNDIHEEIFLLERSALLASAKDSGIDEESFKLGALFRGMSDVPPAVLPQTEVLPSVEGHQRRRPSAMRPADKRAPAEAQATRHENNPDKEKAEKLQTGIWSS